jgi:hypothetical protein
MPTLAVVFACMAFHFHACTRTTKACSTTSSTVTSALQRPCGHLAAWANATRRPTCAGQCFMAIRTYPSLGLFGRGRIKAGYFLQSSERRTRHQPEASASTSQTSTSGKRQAGAHSSRICPDVHTVQNRLEETAQPYMLLIHQEFKSCILLLALCLTRAMSWHRIAHLWNRSCAVRKGEKHLMGEMPLGNAEVGNASDSSWIAKPGRRC